MRVVRDFNSFKQNRNNYQPVNEEFIGKLLGALKGALGKTLGQFAAPFKDMANDIKKLGDKTDPNSIKNMLLTNFNQAIDGMQKAIPNLQKEDEVTALMDNFIKEITELANGLNKDFTAALGEDKAKGPQAIAKAILIGDKDAKWPGIVGLITGTNFKWNKTNYETTLANAAKGKTDKDALIAKQKAAVNFFEGFQKEFSKSLDKDFTEEEMQALAKKLSGAKGPTLVPGKDYNVKDVVKYKTLDYNNELAQDKQQEGAIGEGEVTKIQGDTPNATITIHNKKINKDIEKKEEDILGKADDKGPNAQELAKSLGDIKADETKMKQVNDYVELIKDPVANKTKLDQISKIMGGK